MTEKKLKLVMVVIHICQNDQAIGTYNHVRSRETATNAISLMTRFVAKHSGNIIKTTGGEQVCAYPNAKKAMQSICEMYEAIDRDASLSKINVTIKGGVHYGEVFFQEQEVHGEVLMIANHLVKLAKSRQILLTPEVVKTLPMEMKSEIRSLGRIKVPKKLIKMEVYAKIWESEEASLEDQTILHQDTADEAEPSKLVLKCQGRNFILGEKRTSFLLGRDKKNDIMLQHSSVSREHAKITYDKGKFRLVDHSTNGTYVLTESKERFFVHQEAILLRGKGVISIGQKVAKGNPELIYYALK